MKNQIPVRLTTSFPAAAAAGGCSAGLSSPEEASDISPPEELRQHPDATRILKAYFFGDAYMPGQIILCGRRGAEVDVEWSGATGKNINCPLPHLTSRRGGGVTGRQGRRRHSRRRRTLISMSVSQSVGDSEGEGEVLEVQGRRRRRRRLQQQQQLLLRAA